MLYALLKKESMSARVLALLSVFILFVLCLLQPLADGQDFAKYYGLASGRRGIYNAINFYSFEILFWVPQYLLASQLGPEGWRDLNVIFLFSFPLVFLKSWQKGILRRLVIYYAAVWMFPGSYLLYGNALRQHLMVLFLITLFALFRRWMLIAPLSVLVHKAAILHIPYLISLAKPKLGILLSAMMSGLAFFLGKYFSENDSADLGILISYCILFLAISLFLRDRVGLVFTILFLVYFLSSPVVLERLMLSTGPILGYYLSTQRKLSNSALILMSFLMICLNVSLALSPPESISALYRSVLL